MRTTRSTTVAIVRQETGLSAKAFGELIGKPLTTIKSLESGRLKLSEKMALVISERTGVSMSWLLSGNLEKAPVDNYGKPWNRNTFEVIEIMRPLKRAGLGDSSTTGETIIKSATTRVQSILSRLLSKGDNFLIAASRIDRFLNDVESELCREPKSESRDQDMSDMVAKVKRFMESAINPPVIRSGDTLLPPPGKKLGKFRKT